MSFVGCRCRWLKKEKPCWPSGEQGLKALKSVRISITCSAPAYWVRRYEGS